GPLDPHIEEVVVQNDLVVASVLSGNRNFEARVHQNVKANFLMSPPLVVAFALAGRIGIDMENEALGQDQSGNDVFLRDIWPTPEEVKELLGAAFDAKAFERMYSDLTHATPMWSKIEGSTGDLYDWDTASTYIQEPPFFNNFSLDAKASGDIRGA